MALLAVLLAVAGLPLAPPATAAGTGGAVVNWGRYRQATVPAGLTGVTAIAAGPMHSLALKSDGTVVAWGPTTSGRPLCRPG